MAIDKSGTLDRLFVLEIKEDLSKKDETEFDLTILRLSLSGKYFHRSLDISFGFF
ncbi:hypothetical protein LEP1GSC060_1392 [Leptospira weilii serovar Ranarum str. ICFT]|uniref:Uncharacterized protein n=1 Tax=Leptospira weilii serovar Ranarum str. ICFT TaxID=1218598 RepID=N1WD59_9LEPT|nr:hypothetical protein LEP1GSC060_1392 [Leptospira weilii serovar Ranarum str. ICFT]